MVSTDQDDVTRVFDIDSTVEIGRVQTYSDSVREDRFRLARTPPTRSSGPAAASTTPSRTASRFAAAPSRSPPPATPRPPTRPPAPPSWPPRRRARPRPGHLHRAGHRLRPRRPRRLLAGGAVAARLRHRVVGAAGISRVEGHHGTYGGAQPLADGDLTRPIIGIALTGASGTAVVGDSDGGALDGDPVHDRAVGPMQFIPQTWRRFQQDGDGDGDTDPQNLYDATAPPRPPTCATAAASTPRGRAARRLLQLQPLRGLRRRGAGPRLPLPTVPRSPTPPAGPAP